MTTRLGRRVLNRTLLERQLLLRRHPIGIGEALEHLVGMQAQAPLAPYVGLWDRVAGFNAGDLSGLLANRRIVRTHVMRVTIHLVTAQDCRMLRTVLQPMIARSLGATDFARNLVGVDMEALVAAARSLMAEQALTRPELGRALSERWPDRDPGSLATAATYLVPAVQVPPRGLWKTTGPVAWSTIDSWLGAEPDLPTVTPEDLVLRYLGGYGPASLADMRTWSRTGGAGRSRRSHPSPPSVLPGRTRPGTPRWLRRHHLRRRHSGSPQVSAGIRQRPAVSRRSFPDQS